MTAMRRALVVILWLLAAPGASTVAAHDTTTLRVVADLHGSTSITVNVDHDPRVLLAWIELQDALAPSAPNSEEEALARLKGMVPSIARRISLRVDGAVTLPDVEISDRLPAPSGVAIPAFDAPPWAIVRAHVRLTPGHYHRLEVMTDLAPGTYPFVIRAGDRVSSEQWLGAGTWSTPVDPGRVGAPAPVLQTVATYLRLGFTHIVPLGIDHMAFVLGLFLLGTGWRPLLAQVSAFTLAHSASLALGLLGVVTVPARVVEPLIALSIAWVAVENIVRPAVGPTRVLVVAAFGLMHGLGFAGVLHELGVPDGRFVTALAAFNIGVEGGQLATIGAAALVASPWRSDAGRFRRWIAVPASTMLAAAGVAWMVQRVMH